MLTCIPQTAWSNFQIIGAAASPIYLSYDRGFFSETGTLSIANTEFTIRKTGSFRSHWLLEREGEVYAEAFKPNIFLNRYEMCFGDLLIILRAKSILTRGYKIRMDGAQVGTIEPDHAFTNRTLIECDPSVPEIMQVFCFWLALASWSKDSD